MDYSKIPEAECLLKHTEERMKQNKGINILFTGGVGDGKSFSGSRFLQLWYKKCFNEEFPISHVCNNVEEAVIISKEFNRKGEGILMEEISVHHGRREALTKKNILFNKFFDICRIKQIIFVANCPHISFVDKHFKMMLQSWVNCYEVDFKKEVVLAHPLWLQPFPHKDEPYKHRYLNKDGSPIDFCYFKLPAKKFIEKYNILKEESNEEIFDEIILKLQHDKVKQLEKLGQKVLAPREKEAYVLWLELYSSKESAEKMGLKGVNKIDVYNETLKRAKEKLKLPKYSQNAKEMSKIRKNNEKVTKN